MVLLSVRIAKHSSARRRCLSLLIALAACGGDSSTATKPSEITPPPPPPPPPQSTATVSGTVVVAGTTDPLSGVTVTIGGAISTSDSLGNYLVEHVPVSNNVAISATRRGYISYASVMAVSATGTTRRIGLQLQTVFEATMGAVFIPPGTSTVRGILLCVISENARLFANGIGTTGDATVDAGISASRQAFLPIAQQYGLALMGVDGHGINGDPTGTVHSVLAEVEVVSGRTELSTAPLLIYALSLGIRPAMTIMNAMPDQVAGFFFGIPLGAFGTVTPEILATPGYISVAKVDAEIDNTLTQAFFESGRARGARWAYAAEPGRQHATSTATGAYFAVLSGWFVDVLERRVAVNGALSPSLTPLSESSGWLGDQGTFDIASWSTFPGTASKASWFPSQMTAQLWKTQVTNRP